MASSPGRTHVPNALATTPTVGSSAGHAANRSHTRQSNQQQPRSASTQQPTIRVEDLSSHTTSTEDELSSDVPSSGHAVTTTDSEDAIGPIKKPRMLNLLPGHYILRGVSGQFYIGELSSGYEWGNTVSLYMHHVIRLRSLLKNKRTSIPFYVCKMTKTFTDPEQKMYFKRQYTEANLLQHMHAKHNTLPITSEDRTTRVQARLIKGVDSRATITSGWKSFTSQATMMTGSIYAFAFKSTSFGLHLTIYAI